MSEKGRPKSVTTESEVRFRNLKQMPSTHLLGTGTPMCAGCGGLEALHELYDILGSKTIFVNAAGCMTLLSVYPFTPFRGSWLFTAMASAPAGAQGVRDGLDILKQKLLPEMAEMKADITEVKADIKVISGRLDQMDKRLDQMDKRFEQVEQQGFNLVMYAESFKHRKAHSQQWNQ